VLYISKESGEDTGQENYWGKLVCNNKGIFRILDISIMGARWTLIKITIMRWWFKIFDGQRFHKFYYLWRRKSIFLKYFRNTWIANLIGL
jgi:hypothetical protein